MPQVTVQRQAGGPSTVSVNTPPPNTGPPNAAPPKPVPTRERIALTPEPPVFSPEVSVAAPPRNAPAASAPSAAVSRAASAPEAAKIAAAPLYNGPVLGTIRWSGDLQENGLVTIEGDRASSGAVDGALPGVPVLVELLSKDVAVAEAPAPSNGWKRIVIRVRKKQKSIQVRWSVLP